MKHKQTASLTGKIASVMEAARGIGRAIVERLGTAKDGAGVVAFVASDEARWLTGQNLHAGGVVMSSSRRKAGGCPR